MLTFPTRYLFALQARRKLTCHTITTLSYTDDFTLWPTYFSGPEQRILLTAALRKLDRMDSRAARQQRKAYRLNTTCGSSLQHVFLPDAYYEFEEGHYDGVIHNFREMHLTCWPQDVNGLLPILTRLHSLCPTPKTQTHLLHLASQGYIRPHIDNIDASGSWILGVSLGGERILRMEGPTEDHGNFDIVLPSGSVYLQKNAMRFTFKHSILKGESKDTCQRLSIMIRDVPSPC
ncbi:hypothetical protein BDZ94DRAFT_1270194 [Collybia nuda]|uniref:Alpha-ketoglutarate-dependent dioxygenase AlkB-like domain-containing protein n=1 Tax=Collybia nuda TaxID=64659 RepID=A0A9P5XZS5_9AGAR|nr:hypothetical protein BDZ94DRAFT_1270194 [Collybia nuda]